MSLNWTEQTEIPIHSLMSIRWSIKYKFRGLIYILYIYKLQNAFKFFITSFLTFVELCDRAISKTDLKLPQRCGYLLISPVQAALYVDWVKKNVHKMSSSNFIPEKDEFSKHLFDTNNASEARHRLATFSLQLRVNGGACLEYLKVVFILLGGESLPGKAAHFDMQLSLI